MRGFHHFAALACLSALLLPAPPAQAQGYALRDGDQALDGAGVAQALIGRKILFYDNGESRFSAGGGYSYTYGQGGSAFGVFRIAPDGEVCIAFRNGRTRCDRYVMAGDRLVLLTATGDRYPVRP